VPAGGAFLAPARPCEGDENTREHDREAEPRDRVLQVIVRQIDGDFAGLRQAAK
jgi:hypothetical protein